MRTTIQALLCSLTVACAPVGERGGDDNESPDAGVSDGGSVSGICDGEIVKTMDLNVSATSPLNNLPTTCWRLNGKLTVSGSGVTSVAKLGDLRGVKDLVVDGTSLTKLDTRSPVEVEGEIAIRYNAKLTDLSNVHAKSSLVSSILVEHNAELTNLGGLSKAGVVSGETRIANNPKLTAVNLGSATRLEGGVVIADNAAVTTIDLHSLQSVGNFAVRNNAQLTSLGSLSALEFVHGSISIDNNDNLTTLGTSMTSNLKRVDVTVSIAGNARLDDLGTFARIKYVEGGVLVTGNSALSYCEIREIDCCVDTGLVSHSNNESSSCNVNGYSWCVQELGGCPYM